MRNGLDIRVNGDKHWYLNDLRHREDGPAIELISGTKLWYVNGKAHREDGPACEFSSGNKEWWLNGELHREDGPAIESSYGTKKYWYYHGKRILVHSNEEFLRMVKMKAFW